MNKEDLILQKLESMDAELKNVRSEMQDGFNSVYSELKGVRSEMQDGFNSVETELKGIRSEMKDGFNSVDSELKEIREGSTEMKVNQTRHGGKRDET